VLVGAILYNVINYTVLIAAFRNLPLGLNKHFPSIVWYLMMIIFQSIFCFQYNLVVLYCFLWAFIFLERSRPFAAIILIMLSATTKIYGIVELGMLFCYPKVWKNLGLSFLCGVVFLFLPVIHIGLDKAIAYYQDWFSSLSEHQTVETFMSIFYASILDKFLLPHSRLIQIVSFVFLLACFFASNKKWANPVFRAKALGVLMGWVILFSDVPEIHTYVIALSGYLMVYWLKERRTVVDKALYVICWFLFCLVPIDILCPPSVYHFLDKTLSLNIYVFVVIWIGMLYDTLQTRRA